MAIEINRIEKGTVKHMPVMLRVEAVRHTSVYVARGAWHLGWLDLLHDCVAIKKAGSDESTPADKDGLANLSQGDKIIFMIPVEEAEGFLTCRFRCAGTVNFDRIDAVIPEGEFVE